MLNKSQIVTSVSFKIQQKYKEIMCQGIAVIYLESILYKLHELLLHICNHDSHYGLFLQEFINKPLTELFKYLYNLFISISLQL